MTTLKRIQAYKTLRVIKLMELRVYRFIFAAAIAITLFATSSAWSQTAAPPNNASTATAATANGTNAKASKEAALAQLKGVYQELSKMVPGGVAAGSPTEKSLFNTIALFAQRKPNEALQSLKDLAAADKTFPPSGLMLAAIAYAINDPTAGSGLLENAAITNEDYPDVFFSFGQIALKQGRFADAEAQAELALQKIQGGSFNQQQIDYFKRRYYEIKFQIAKARKQMVKAKSFLDQLEAVAPDSPQTLIGKAELTFESGNTNEALKILQRLESISENSTQKPELTIASWFERAGKAQNADLWITKAATKYEDDVRVQLAVARWMLNREKFTDALKAADALELVAGKTNASKELRAKVAFAQGAYATAEANFEDLLTKNPANIDYANMFSLSMIQSTDQEKQKKALALARKVAQTQPNNPIGLSSLAYVMLKLGETDGARAILGKVAQMPNRSSEVKFIMAYMLSETGQMPQAKALLDNVIKAKGLFLFRVEAEKLLKTVEQSTQGLPEPGK